MGPIFPSHWGPPHALPRGKLVLHSIFLYPPFRVRNAQPGVQRRTEGRARGASAAQPQGGAGRHGAVAGHTSADDEWLRAEEQAHSSAKVAEYHAAATLEPPTAAPTRAEAQDCVVPGRLPCQCELSSALDNALRDPGPSGRWVLRLPYASIRWQK